MVFGRVCRHFGLTGASRRRESQSPISLAASAFPRFVKQKEMRDESAAKARRGQKQISKIAALYHYHLVFLSFIWNRDPQAPSGSSLRVALPHTHWDLLNIWQWKVGQCSQDLGLGGWGVLLLRGMPSANQLIGGKNGLNEANDSTAITAERSTLNIGIPVWNEWKGLRGGSRS